MANFLRRFVHSKSRSKSPVKQPSNVVPESELFEHHWTSSARYPNQEQMHPMNHPPSPPGKQKYFYPPSPSNHHHEPRNRSPKKFATSTAANINQAPPTPPSHYFTPDYKSTMQQDGPYQRMDSFATLNSPQSARSLPFGSLSLGQDTTNPQRQSSHHTSNGMLLSPGAWSQFPPTPSPGQQPHPRLSNYGYSTEYLNNGGLNTWNTRTTHSGPGSFAAPADNTTYGGGTTTATTTYEPNGTLLSQAAASSTRPRSTSPKKPLKSDEIDQRKHRSRSPAKKSSSRSTVARTFDYLHPQCKMEGCSAVIIIEDSRFLVCKHQLSHASDFFRTLFLNNRALPIEGVKQNSLNEYTIVVSAMKHPPQMVQFQWFLECTIPCPLLKDITEDTLETCMRLCKRFTAKGLEFRCAKFIQENVSSVQPMMALCWLNWVFKHRFDRLTHDACLPVVARLPLNVLENHRQMMPEKILVDLLAMKLRSCYQQTVKVFHTIHRMDHFSIDLERCPRCGRQREQGKVRVLANPCNKLIGCERCLQDLGCEIERKSQGEYQAFYQCEHGLWPFNEKTEDCQCQTELHKTNFQMAHSAKVVESSPSSNTLASNAAPNPVHLSLNPLQRNPPS